MQPSGGGAVVRGGRSRLGFCPQQDALLELLTGAEQLALYARLKARPAALVGSTARPPRRDSWLHVKQGCSPAWVLIVTKWAGVMCMLEIRVANADRAHVL